MFNMHELFHIIGICPDTLTHPHLIGIFIVSYQNILSSNYRNIKQYIINFF